MRVFDSNADRIGEMNDVGRNCETLRRCARKSAIPPWNEIVVREENARLNAVVYDDGQFFVARNDGTVFSSFDDLNWTRLSIPFEGVDYRSAAWNGWRLLLAGGVSDRYLQHGIYRPNGLSGTDGGAAWDIFDIDSSYRSNGLAWGNRRFVSVGTSMLSDEGAIYTTD